MTNGDINIELIEDSIEVTADTLVGLHGGTHEEGGSDPIQIEDLEDIGGDVSLDTGETVIDYSAKEIPQGFLGGPASQLSQYPLTTADIASNAIGNSSLVNDSITIDAQNGLKNGGTVALGDSVRLDVEPADFAGDFLSDDGNDLLDVDIGRGLEDDGFDNIRVNEDTDFDFTAQIRLSGGANLGADLVDGAQVIWDATAQEIPDTAMGSIDNATLTNASITITAGDGLKNGGQVFLGNTVTLNVDSSDIAGDFLTADLNENLDVQIGRGLEDDGSGNIQFDEDETYTFTQDQLFQSEVDVRGNIVDDAQTVWDSVGQEIPDSAMGSIDNATLTNSDVTVTAGNQLTGGGTVALGSSITIDVDEGPGSGLDADTLDGFEASELGVDVTNNGTTVTTGATDIDFTNGITASDDGDNTSTVQLTNDSVTVTAGNQLTGGGAVTLGSSITIDVDEGPGSGLDADTVDGFEATELGVDVSEDGVTATTNAVDINFTTGLTATDDGDNTSTVVLEEAYAATWTSQHTFNAGLDTGADIVDGAQVIWDNSVQEIPDSALGTIDNATLANSAVTVTAGDGIKGGGSVSLGGTTTLNVEPADFAGAGLVDDGSDNLAVNAGNGIAILSDFVRVDQSFSPTWTGSHTFNGGTTFGTDSDYGGSNLPTNLAAPVDANDATRKAYVDSTVQGATDIKESVVAATNGTNVNLASATDPNPIDGVTVTDGQRVLLKNQSDATENGLYLAVTATDPTTWVRTADADEDVEFTSGLFTFVEEGTENGNSSWIVTTPDPITLGATSITFAQFSSAGEITAGDGLRKSGQTLRVEPSDLAGTFLSDDGADNFTVDIGRGLENDGSGNIQFDEDTAYTYTTAQNFSAGLDTQGDVTDGAQVIWDASAQEIPDSAMGSIDNATLTNDSVTVTAGDGLKNGGIVALGSSITIDIEPADFAGAGLQDDGADNLELINDSVTVNANDGLVGGGTVALGGSIGLDIEPADFAGTFLSDDGADNLTVDIGFGLENDGSGNIQFDEDTNYTFTGGTITVEDSGGGSQIPSFVMNGIGADAFPQFEFQVDGTKEMSVEYRDGDNRLAFKDFTQGVGEIIGLDQLTGDWLDGTQTIVYDASAQEVPFARLGESANIARLDQAETVAGAWDFSSQIDFNGGATLPSNDLESGDTNSALEVDERASVANAGKVAVSRDADVHGYAMIEDVTNNTACMVYLGGPANTVEILHDSGSGNNFTVTEDNAGTTNIYWDAGNSQYELNNETGASATYALQILKS